MHEKNELAEQKWYTIITIKDLMLINSRLSNRFWAETIKIDNYLQNRLPTKSKNYGEMILEKT